ncbi:hypothetical protein [Streptomyces sp. NPDC093594]
MRQLQNWTPRVDIETACTATFSGQHTPEAIPARLHTQARATA